MLHLKIPISQSYDEETNRFINNCVEVRMEHSLLSLSKWEEEYEKPFLAENADLDHYEILDYFRCMCIDPEDVKYIDHLTKENIETIQAHIEKKATASWITESKKAGARSGETVTSELIYYWMFSSQIPKDCETWHLNRLLMLIRIFAKKQETPKKMSRAELLAQRRELNAKRQAQYNTRG